MTRIAVLKREQMDAEQGKVFDEVKAAGGPLGGPYWAYIRFPRLMRLAQDMSTVLGQGGLSKRERQLAREGLAEHHRCPEDRLDVLVPDPPVHRCDGIALERPGRIHQHAQGSQPGGDGGNERRHLGLDEEIGAEGGGAAAAGLDLAREGLGLGRRIAIVHGESEAAPRQGQRQLAADALGGAGHQRDAGQLRGQVVEMS